MGKIKLNIILKGLCFFFLALGAVNNAGAAVYKEIKPSSVMNMIKEGSNLWLIDVRGEKDFNDSHIVSSINIPHSSLKFRKIPSNKLLVLVDNSLGLRRAYESAKYLTDKGFEKVFVLSGGIYSWRLSKYPFYQKKKVIKGVNAEDFLWALDNDVKVKVFDLRDEESYQQFHIENSNLIDGEDVSSKVKNINNKINKIYKKRKKNKLAKNEPIVFILPLDMDIEDFFKYQVITYDFDVRFLIGGIESINLKRKKVFDGCNTCSTIIRGDE